ncbi:MAG: methyltransferase domain-containing protein [Candidatus Bathyarchaeota archaeon]|nr:MAG: methyltransferase domain-containing protein [Candidatus Bathyarchaeota archaeon]
MREFDKDYFEGETSPINYESFSYRVTAWLRFRTLISILSDLNRKTGILVDVGCAFGDFIYKFSEKGYKAVGCDVSKWAIRKAKRLYPNIDIILADVNALPFKEKTFDIVTMLETLEHCQKLNKVLEEISRIATANGLVIFSIPTTDLNDTQADKTHIWHLSLTEWLKIFERKFRLVKIKYFLKNLKYINKKASNTFVVLQT